MTAQQSVEPGREDLSKHVQAVVAEASEFYRTFHQAGRVASRLEPYIQLISDDPDFSLKNLGTENRTVAKVGMEGHVEHWGQAKAAARLLHERVGELIEACRDQESAIVRDGKILNKVLVEQVIGYGGYID